MNYRHAFHAGGPADVVKHAVLARCLSYLCAKPAPFRFVDTHAGAGLYDLAGPAAERTGEWRAGVGRLVETSLAAAAEAVLEPYRAALAAANPGGELRSYPGSPEIARHLARPQDRLTCIELHEADAAKLAERCRRDDRVAVVRLDGWTALNAYVPPGERRGLVLIDPPFEEPGDLVRLREGLARAHRKWATGTYLLWYPIKDVMEIERFARAVSGLEIPDILRVELLVRRPRDTARLNGSGLLIVNPPWRLAADLSVLMPALAELLADGPGARARVDMLRDEKRTA